MTTGELLKAVRVVINWFSVIELCLYLKGLAVALYGIRGLRIERVDWVSKYLRLEKLSFIEEAGNHMITSFVHLHLDLLWRPSQCNNNM
jgi:hypothetical protein